MNYRVMDSIAFTFRLHSHCQFKSDLCAYPTEVRLASMNGPKKKKNMKCISHFWKSVSDCSDWIQCDLFESLTPLKA